MYNQIPYIMHLLKNINQNYINLDIILIYKHDIYHQYLLKYFNLIIMFSVNIAA